MQNRKITDITTFDEDIRRFHDSFKLPFTWNLLKAQLYQESCLNPEAESPIGAKGLAQFMPDTWKEYTIKCGYPSTCSRIDAHASIHCCAAYMRRLIDSWGVNRSEHDRYSLALASYNAGLGNLIRAQKIVRMAMDFPTIISSLHVVTGGANATQTKNYVKRIWEYNDILVDYEIIPSQE